MLYTLGLLSPISVVSNSEPFQTLDLWARDLQAQVAHTSRLKLFCPLLQAAPANWVAMGLLPKGIEVIPIHEMCRSRISSAIADCDVIQVPGGQGWHESRVARQFVQQARLLSIKSIVGISSNRARSALLNVKPGAPLTKLKGFLKYASIQCAQRYLTRNTDGTFIVGEGLRSLVSPRCKSLHIGIASWIRQSDLEEALRQANKSSDFPIRRLCIAARLERMKGVHIGIEAIAKVVGWPTHGNYNLTILGVGPERESLQEQVRLANLAEYVQFGGVRSYPSEFFAELRQHDLVLLTNLSDEQPRLIFDAISQGCIPVIRFPVPAERHG